MGAGPRSDVGEAGMDTHGVRERRMEKATRYPYIFI
jgi:hypothetical protein